MKNTLNCFLVLTAFAACGTLSSCTTNVTPAAPSTMGSATMTTTTQAGDPYVGTTTTQKRTTTTQY